MTTVLTGVGELERKLPLQRTNEGRARAMAEGKSRKRSLTKFRRARP